MHDQTAARWTGFGARSYSEALPNRYERQLARFADSTDSVSTWLAVTARQTRLELPPDGVSKEVKALQRVAVDVAGPFLVSYCLWLLGRAVEEKLERLYFLSRDGEVLWHITQALADALGVPVQLRYLYGGRLSWQLPALAVAADDDAVVSLLNLTFFQYTIVRPSGVAVRLGVPVRVVHEALALSRGGAEDDRPLTPEERTAVHAALTSSEGIAAIRRAAAASLPPTLAYLRQEGLFDASPWALVDVGWRGTTVRTLNTLLRSGGGSEARVFFTGYVGEGGEERLSRCEAFIWDTDRADRRPPPAGALAIIEALSSGTHGPIAGYARQAEGCVRPVFLSEFGHAKERWWLEELRAALMRFVENLVPHLRPAHLLTVDPRAALAVLTELCERPHRDEALAIGSCPREEDALGDSVFRLARPYRLRELPNLLRSGHSIGRNLGWCPGALAMSPRFTRQIVRATLAASNLARRLLRERPGT